MFKGTKKKCKKKKRSLSVNFSVSNSPFTNSFLDSSQNISASEKARFCCYLVITFNKYHENFSYVFKTLCEAF